MTRYVLLTFVAAAVPGLAQAQLVSYDANSFPEESGDGWIRLEALFPAERWLDAGWLFQAPIVLPCPPKCWTQDYYRRKLTDQSGLSSWHLAWVMVTDGPQAFGAVAPAVIVAGGTSGLLYHFTIAKDRARLIRGSQFPIVFADLEEGVPHLFRLELRNTPPPGTYLFTIDGEVIDEGVAEGFYPTDDSRITFGASAAIEDSVTRWDFVRFGRIPDPGSGDMTGDGLIDLEDFRFFLECADAGGPETDTMAGCLFADMDQDGDVDFHDFKTFQLAFTGPE